jgi:hypothetical protein
MGVEELVEKRFGDANSNKFMGPAEQLRSLNYNEFAKHH